MKLINPSFEILEQGPGLQGIYKQIELAGRTCYKSLDKVTEDSAEGFVNRMIASKHYAMLEHGTVCLKVQDKVNEIGMTVPDLGLKGNYSNNPYSRVNYQTENIKLYDRVLAEYAPVTTTYITTNLRVLVENGWLDDLKYLCEPTEFHEKRITVRFTTDIGVSREANRHRVDSIAEQSTRYCNYSKDKFGNQITVTNNDDIPNKEYFESLRKWSRGDIQSPKSAFRTMCGEIYNFKEDQFSIVDLWIFGNAACEFAYMELIKRGWTPQQARRVLPLDLCTELVHTAFISDWEHFFDLRAKGTTGAPHPDMKALAEPLMHSFEARHLV